ncbi:hypothetical protein FKM82_023849 [Ascaphus truei]
MGVVFLKAGDVMELQSALITQMKLAVVSTSDLYVTSKLSFLKKLPLKELFPQLVFCPSPFFFLHGGEAGSPRSGNTLFSASGTAWFQRFRDTEISIVLFGGNKMKV